MPLIVRHDERRNWIATVVKRIVAEAGMEAVTVRNVAREAGFSSTIVSHYFRDKRELLSFTYGSIRIRANQMIEAAFRRNADLLECFATLLPIDDANLADWQAWFGFWGKTTADPELAAERNAGVAGTQELFQRILERAKAEGELPRHVDIAIHAKRLQIFINGLASFVVMEPGAWPPEAQKAVLAAEIDTIKAMKPESAEAGIARGAVATAERGMAPAELRVRGYAAGRKRKV